METIFSPTPPDVERYQRLRTVVRELNNRMAKTIPKRAFAEVGDALGIRHNGVLEFDNEDETSVLMDCILYDWFQNGKNLVQRYAAAHLFSSGTDEDIMMRACLKAKYRIVSMESSVPGAGVRCKDLLNGGNLFLMDVAMSQLQHVPNGCSLATRTMPVDAYWITGGAALPIDKHTRLVESCEQIERDYSGLLEGRDKYSVSLGIIRACLAAGASKRIRYEVTEPIPKKPRHGDLLTRKQRRV